ncbi:MAG: 2-phospho-L-lactate transferase CofD family protein [Candidatus Omnitrophota bacterium]
MVKIALFCGGRGSASIIREILRFPGLQLHLLVNAYDNGSSTGELRRYIPGYLGPSDFRKNLSYLLELYSPEQYTLSQLLDYRMPQEFSEKDVPALISYLRNSTQKDLVPLKLVEYLESIHGDLRDKLNEYLLTFFDYYQKPKEMQFDFKNCSFGNFLFAGAFLKNNQDFDQATRELMRVFQSKTNASLMNVTKGENRFLIGLKEDGQLLDDEEKIVSGQSAAKFDNIYLIPEPLTSKDIEDFDKLPLEDKKVFLSGKEKPVYLSQEVEKVLLEADIIIYGPGTQFSSLFPSYKTQGIGKAIAASRAKAKVFVMNLTQDCDIHSYSAEDLLDCALGYLGDSQNKNNLITHVLVNDSLAKNETIQFRNGVPENNEYKGIKITTGSYANAVYPAVHNGRSTLKSILDIYDQQKLICLDELDIYVDLNERSVMANLMIEEFLEIDWKQCFCKVRLIMNKVSLKSVKLPEYVSLEEGTYTGLFAEVDIFKSWLTHKNSKYLVTMTGDGEYRFRDILNSVHILENSSFGAVYGSRNQSREQYLHSLHAAYGESHLLFILSRLGSMIMGAFFVLKLRTAFSDPLTGLRVYNRSVLKESLKPLSEEVDFKTPVTLTRFMVKNHIEIAEIPVQYRTFKGFTNMKWRLSRGWRNLMGMFS